MGGRIGLDEENFHWWATTLFGGDGEEAFIDIMETFMTAKDKAQDFAASKEIEEVLCLPVGWVNETSQKIRCDPL